MDYLRASKLGLNYMVRPRELEKMVSQLEFGFVLFKHLKQNIESFPFFLKERKLKEAPLKFIPLPFGHCPFFFFFFFLGGGSKCQYGIGHNI